MIRVVGLVLAMALVSLGPAHAHDFWINWGGYKAPTGEHCCGDNDCKILDPATVKATPRGYALSNGEVVPYSEAMPSEDGNYWRCSRYDGSRRCFFTPRPGS